MEKKRFDRGGGGCFLPQEIREKTLVFPSQMEHYYEDDFKSALLHA